MAKLNYKCGECKNDFDVQYLIFRPEKVKCPHCGGHNVSEETKQLNKCGCGDTGGKPPRFT
ncbi:MAG: FmdB family zinc ribbon protein [Desulfocucumaceae bacterium]